MADLAVVVGDVLEQPVDRVVGVAALVDVLRPLGRVVRPHVDERPLRHPAAANVLVDEDVPFLAEQRRRAKVAGILIVAVGPDAGLRAGQQDRVLAARVLRGVDRGEEADAVAHGDLVLGLGVVRLDVLDALSRKRCAEGGHQWSPATIRTPGRQGAEAVIADLRVETLLPDSSPLLPQRQCPCVSAARPSRGRRRVRSALRIDGHRYVSMCSTTISVPRAWLTCGGCRGS